MNYIQTLEYLYQQLPIFQRQGQSAFKVGLKNSISFAEYLGNPHQKFKSIHIAGTNGKGSSAHLTAAILQSAGYKTGLYTSPHLKEFTERIRIDGQEVTQNFVVYFVQKHRQFIEQLKPSFFEVTVAMAFDYFASQQVDIAVVEVGLGGRLDTTNILEPEISLITNISYDHQEILGDTLEKIAFEKAGIIKPNTPVIISETQAESAPVFQKIASEKKAEIQFADQIYSAQKSDNQSYTIFQNEVIYLKNVVSDLKGEWQTKNILGVLALVKKLKNFTVSEENLREGIANVTQLTGLKGRWQILQHTPTILCDTGHNEAGIKLILEQIKTLKFNQLHMVWGMVKDKDIKKILKLLPKDAMYYFCQPDIIRGLSAEILAKIASEYKLKGEIIPKVLEATERAKQKANQDDLIFIGGSTFVVAELNLI